MKWISPTWHAPSQIKALSTLREGGVSSPPFESFNLGSHVGDDLQAVEKNRKILTQEANLPCSPLFLNQIHSTRVIRLPYGDGDLNADAVYTNQCGQVCLVMTADCLPVLFHSQAGNEVAAAHAGWRGLCNGILEATVAEFACSPEKITAWLGPAIGRSAFQVGKEVVEQFCAIDPLAVHAFVADPNHADKFLGDLYFLARQRLNRLGIEHIYGGEYCTYQQADQFFSYRREGKTGRMASLVWIEPSFI